MVLVLVGGADPAGSDAAARDGAATALEDGGSPSPTGEGRKGSMTEERHYKTHETRRRTSPTTKHDDTFT